MTTGDLATAAALNTKITKINAIQAKIATAGYKLVAIITDADNNGMVSRDDLIEVIGDTAYNLVCSNAKSALSTAIQTAETTAQTAFDAL